MKVTDNTILITGGASGIGRGLAEAFHKLGNQVIISGRRQEALDEVTAANPGMQSLRLDIGDKAGVAAFAEEVGARYPNLNVLINNAGIMQPEDIATAPGYLDIAEQTIATTLLGPILPDGRLCCRIYAPAARRDCDGFVRPRFRADGGDADLLPPPRRRSTLTRCRCAISCAARQSR